MSKDTKQKQWYLLPNGVEYSVDSKFFVENQIHIVRSGKRYQFCSQLETKKFKDVIAVNKAGTLPDSEIELTCKEIHKEILSGKHGQGVITN
jgi:hypothetical protein